MGIAAILLCGGKGTRMIERGVHTHKPLLKVGGMPATKFVAMKLRDGFSFSQTLIVVPNGREEEYRFAMKGLDCQIITQSLPLGTGNAVYESLKFLDEDIDCLMSSPDDLMDWIFKIKKLLADEILCKKLSDNSYQKFLINYTWEIRAEKVLNIMKKNKIDSI